MKRFASIGSWLGLLILAVITAAAFPGPALAHTGHGSTALPLLAVGGMIVNKSSLDAVFLNLKTTFNKAFDAASGIWQKTTMLVPSGSSQNNYDWLSRFPKMRKWVGDKQVKALEAHSYTIVNENFEATVEVKRDDIEDDQLGIYAPMAQEAGFSAKTLPDELDAEVKNGAFVNKCYDGKAFYATNHVVGKKSFSNKGTKALDTSTRAKADGSYGAARVAIMSVLDEDGRPLGLVPNILEVPPALEAMARTMVTSAKLDDNSPNPYNGTAEVVVNPRLTSATAWFLHCTTRPVKPFVYQQRKAPVFVQQTSMDTEDVFMRGTYKFGAEARGASGYAFWQLSYGSDGTVA